MIAIGRETSPWLALAPYLEPIPHVSINCPVNRKEEETSPVPQGLRLLSLVDIDFMIMVSMVS